MGGLGLKAGVLVFSCIWYLPLVSEFCLEASAGFLEGRAHDGPLVVGAGSWVSVGQGHA